MTKVFVPENGERVIAIIRPSLWRLAPGFVLAAAFLLSPFVFVFPLLGLGMFGIGLGVVSFVFGLRRVVVLRKKWLRGSLIVTDERVVDVIRLGRRPRLLSIDWSHVSGVEVVRSFFGRVLGFGHVYIHAKGKGLSLEFQAMHNPEAIKKFLLEVQLVVRDAESRGR